MSLNQGIDQLLDLAPGQDAFKPFQHLADRLSRDLERSLSDDLEPASFTKLLRLFTMESYDQIYRRQAGNLILELLKHSDRAQPILQQVDMSLKKGIGQVVLSPNPDVLKYLAGSIVQLQHHRHSWPPSEFWPSDESQVAAVFPTSASSNWAQDFQEFVNQLVERGVAEHSATVSFYATAVNDGDGRPLQNMKFDYLVPGKILCELNELHLTCARIATEMDKRSWFLDLSISHIIHSIPHVRLKPKNKRIGQAYHGLITHDQLELKLDTLRSNWLFNGTRQQGEILILVLDSANEVKEVANDFKDRMHKKLITSSIPIVGAIACESSDPSEPNLEPTGNKAAALRDSQTNKTVSASQVNEDRSEHARDITVVHDSHGRADKEQVSEVEDPRDDGPCDNSGYTATSSRTRTQGDHGSISKDAKKQVRPPKAQPRKEIESLAQPNPSTTNRTAAQPLEDTYTQLYAQNDASHKAKPGKTYMSKGKDSDASAKKQTQATKTAAGKRKTRSAGQYKPGDAFSAVDALVRQKKQRIEPVANTMAAGVEVEEDIVASEVKTTKSSKTTTTTTSKTRRRLEREDQEFIEAQLDANNVPTQLPATNRGKKTGVREAGRVDNQKKASQAKQDQDTFSHIEQDGEDAAYADIDLLPQGPQLKPTKPGSKVAAKAARPTVSENKLMAEVIDLQTPDAKSVENFTTVVNYPVLALPDDRMNRKARIIEFGTRGPRNQGTESPDKTSEQKAPSMPQQSILEDAKPRPIPSHGARAPKAVLTPSHELTNVASNTQDEDIEEITVAPDPGHTAAVLDFSPEVSVIIDRTGSQLSQRVSGEGSPYSKNTRLPVARPRGSHGLNTSSDQVSNKDRAPTKVLEPAFEYVQLLKSSLPPSRNPDNDVDRPSRERTLAKAMAAATSAAPAFVVQPVRKLQGDQHSIAPLVETTKKAQSHTAGRMLPPQKLTKPSGTGTDNSDFSDVLAQSKAITTKSQPSIAGSLESSIKAKATSGTIPKKLAPDTPVPTLIVSKRSRVAPQASAKIGTQAQLHPRPVQFVKPVQGEFLTHPPAKQQTSRTVRGRLDQPNPQGDFIQTVLEPSTSTKVSQEEGRNAAARLQQDPTASSRPRTATKASVDMVNMLIERDAHENGAKSILILSPAPRLPTNIGLSSRAQEMPSSDIEQEISRPMDEESIPVPLEADPVPVPEVATDPVIPESKFTTLLKKRVFQEQLKPLLSEALHLHEDVEDSEQTLVEADGDTHILDEPAGDDQPEVGFENQESQEENKHESYDDVRMSDHSSNNSDRSSEVPERGAEEDEDEEGGDSDPEAREQEADAEYVAYQQQMAWQKALQPHQEEYHESFTSISMQLLRHILNDETSIRAIITDYETGGMELVRRLEECHADEERTHVAISKDAATHLKDGLIDLAADLDVDFYQGRETARNIREYKKLHQEATDEALGNLDRMIELCG